MPHRFKKDLSGHDRAQATAFRWGRRASRREGRLGTGSSRFGSLNLKSGHMKKEYDFSKGKRGAIVSSDGKTRITIYLDDVVIERFKALSEKTGKGYQTLVNDALRVHLGVDEVPVTATVLRRILREELAQHD